MEHAERDRAIPALDRRRPQLARRQRAIDCPRGVTVEPRHAQHRVLVLRVAGESSSARGELGREGIGLAGHHGGDARGIGARRVAVVRQTLHHQQRAEVGVAKAERPVVVGVLGDPLRRVGGEADHDLLRQEEHAVGVAVAVDVEAAVLAVELHQIDRGQVAGRVVEERKF